MSQTSGPPPTVIESFSLEPDSIDRLAVGLINETYAADRTDGSACILQRVSSIFPPEINDDIEAVTEHLSAKGLPTPQLVATTAGHNRLEAGGDIWRLLTRIEGETVEALGDADAAREAGRVVGAFHQALADFERELRCRRPPVHDISRHIGALRLALAEHARHSAHGAVEELADGIFALAEKLEPLPESPLRTVHGDPKISNVIFNAGRGICLVDLDTIARLPAAIELGDAMRSWCNPAGEDSPDARFVLESFRAALEGYRDTAPRLLTEAEWRAVPNATLGITVELAARFAADALNESYFSWDPDRFGGASEHNLTRASSQLKLARDIAQRLADLHQIIVTLT
ncbi:MAG TPA: phosphotransferase [Gammaproteobacteria bacterium]